MRHLSTYLTFIALLIGTALITINFDYIQAQPKRTALIKNSNGDIEKVRLRSIASLTDAKIQKWAEKVLATCLTLTPDNSTSKASYCADTYFNSSAAAAYYFRYAQPIAKQIAEPLATQYVTLKKKPFIIHRPSARKPYYRLRGTLSITRVSRSERIPQTRGYEVFVKPLVNSKNPSQYIIVGIKI